MLSEICETKAMPHDFAYMETITKQNKLTKNVDLFIIGGKGEKDEMGKGG